MQEPSETLMDKAKTEVYIKQQMVAKLGIKYYIPMIPQEWEI